MTALSPRRHAPRRSASALARRSLALQWYRHLRAPQKHLYSYPDAGHATAFEHADDVRRILERTLASSTHDRSR